MELPKTPIKPNNRNPRSLLIYGPPKFGKTTILSQLEDNLIVDIEQGSNFVEALKMQANNLTEFNETCKAIYKAGQPYKYSTLDTISKLEDWCERSATAKYKQSAMGRNFTGQTVLELDYGKGYQLLRTEFKQWMDVFKRTSEHIIFIGHVKDSVIEKEGDQVSVKDIDLTGKLKSITAADVDAIGYVYVDPDDNTKRRITFFADDDTTAGSRCSHLDGEDFVISEQDDKGNIITHWDKIFID